MTPWQLRFAVRTVRSGGILAYPTEAVYGLGCDPLNANAIFRLLEVKRRPVEKGLILIAAHYEQLRPYIIELNAEQRMKLEGSWPGPVTWLIPCRSETPQWLTGSHNCIAVRIPDHPVCIALCQQLGHALVSSSANISQRPAARTTIQIQKQLAGQFDYLLPGALGNRSKPSEIRDLLSGSVIRPA